jgi:hypothetical protein
MFRTRNQSTTITEETDMTWTAYPPRDYPEREWIEDESSPWYVAPDMRDDYALAFPRDPQRFPSPQIQPLAGVDRPWQDGGFNEAPGITWKPATEDDLRGMNLVTFDPMVPQAIVWLSEIGNTWTHHRRTISQVNRARANAPRVAEHVAASRTVCECCGALLAKQAGGVLYTDNLLTVAGRTRRLCSTCRATTVVLLGERASNRDQVTTWLDTLT